MLNNVLKLVNLYISERSTADDQCLIFMKEINNYSANSKLTKAKVKYTAFGKTYTFDLKQPMPCKPAANIQNVEMVLICEGKTSTRYTHVCLGKVTFKTSLADTICLTFLTFFSNSNCTADISLLR